jgi:hypothetical protein
MNPQNRRNVMNLRMYLNRDMRAFALRKVVRTVQNALKHCQTNEEPQELGYETTSILPNQHRASIPESDDAAYNAVDPLPPGVRKR